MDNLDKESIELLEKMMRISQLPSNYRTLDDTETYMKSLSKFEIFNQKVLEGSLDEVLKLATRYLKYMKVPAGKFLYHIGQPSDYIYLVVKGEAWKYRMKTEVELEHDLKLRNKKATNTPKILETIALAKALNERNRMQTSSQKSPKSSVVHNQPANQSQHEKSKKSSLKITNIPKEQADEIKIIEPRDNTLLPKKEFEIFERRRSSQISALDQNKRLIQANLRRRREGILNKIRATKNMLNFENDYIFALIKQSEELAKKYIPDKICTIKFEKKYSTYETLGEMSTSLNQTRNSSVLAYTELHLLVLDQKSYEKVFFAQLDHIKEKLSFFSEYFKDISFNAFKKICFLFTEKTFKLGDIIYKEGQPCDNLYFIKTGEVHLLKNLNNGENSSSKGDKNLPTSHRQRAPKSGLVASVLAGEFFGEESLSGSSKSKSKKLFCMTLKVLSRLPERIIKKLQEISKSKENWRGDRIENIKKQTSIKSIPKSMTEFDQPFSSKTKSRNLDDEESSSDRTYFRETQKKEGFLTPLTARTPREESDLTPRKYPSCHKDFRTTYSAWNPIQNDKNCQLKVFPTSINSFEKLDDSPQSKSLTFRNRTVTSLKIKTDFLKLNLKKTTSQQPLAKNKSLTPKKALEGYKNTLNLDSSPDYGLQPCSSNSLDDQDFDFNFITKFNKRKKSENESKQTELLEETISQEPKSSIQIKDFVKTYKNSNAPESSMARTISDLNIAKFKERIISITSREKFDIKANNFLPEPRRIKYFGLKPSAEYQTSATFRTIDDSKASPLKDTFQSLSRVNSGIILSDLDSSPLIKMKPQSQIKGAKVKTIL